MGVLIKDMDMPKTCEDCPFHVYRSHHEYFCVATPMFYPMNLANSKGIRKDWCPLSEAPEPCDDAISRQAAIDAMCSACGYECDKSEFIYNAPQDEQVILCQEHYALTQLPSAQPERMRGRWVKHDTGHSIYYDCSLCGCIAPCTEVSDSFIWKLSTYCPDCGVKMGKRSRTVEVKK